MLPFNGLSTTPTVVIGLGGTGRWVLTHLKQNLRETYQGQVPKTVRLLSFDSGTPPRGADKRVDEDVAYIEVGDTRLDEGSEAISLGADSSLIHDICDSIIANPMSYPHIRSWLQARTYRAPLPGAVFRMPADSPGQRRPFGRMLAFLDLSDLGRSIIHRSITEAIHTVCTAALAHHVDVFIVASLAGQTGGGLFIDFAHLARSIARGNGTNVRVRGMLVLHNTFGTVTALGPIRPNVYAAVRELDRFMLVFDQSYPITYNPHVADFRTTYGGTQGGGRLFDSCYLIDASRPNFPLDAEKPKNGVYPSIADAITAMVDDAASNAFDLYYMNAAGVVALAQTTLDQATYSSLGTYRMVLPVEDIITSLSYRFSLEVLVHHLLDLQEVRDDAGNVRYELNYRGPARQEAEQFLRMPTSTTGVASTNFIQTVAQIAVINAENAELISSFAQQTAGELLPWILPPDADPTVRHLAEDVRRELNLRLAETVLTSVGVDDEDCRDGVDRVIRETAQVKEKNLGIVGNDGRRTGGRFSAALEQCRRIHGERYRTLLREHVIGLLNGPEPANPLDEYQKAKTGQLARVQAQLAALSTSLQKQIAFIDAVAARRAADGLLQSALASASSALTALNDSRTQPAGFIDRFFQDRQPACRAQADYIEAEQAAIDTELIDLMLQYLRSITDDLRRMTDELALAVGQWIATLVEHVGGARSTADPGLLKVLQSKQTKHQRLRNEKQHNYRLIREYLTDERYEQGLYQERTEGNVPKLLANFVWSLTDEKGQPVLALQGFQPVGGIFAGQTSSEINANRLLTLAKAYFEPLRNTLNIADRLASQPVAALADRLRTRSTPLIQLDPVNDGGMRANTSILAVQHGTRLQYFNLLDGQLAVVDALTTNNRSVSSDRNSLTMLSCTDAFVSAGVTSFGALKTAYNTYTADARLLHNFPAEVNAVHLEQSLPRIYEVRRQFSPRLTAMLEQLRDVRSFMRAYLYGQIRLSAIDAATSCWQLFLPPAPGLPAEIYSLTFPEASPSLLKAMETFVFKKHDAANAARPINQQLLNQELDRIEQTATESDSHRTINFFRLLDNQRIRTEALHQSPEQQLKDLGAVMLLLLQESIDGLMNRIKAEGGTLDPNRGPLIDVGTLIRTGLVVPAANGTTANGTTANGTTANGTTANGTTANGTTANGTTANGTTANGTTANGTTANAALAVLRELYDQHLSGELKLRQLTRRTRGRFDEGELATLEPRQLRSLREAFDDLDSNDITPDDFVKVLEKLLGISSARRELSSLHAKWKASELTVEAFVAQALPLLNGGKLDGLEPTAVRSLREACEDFSDGDMPEPRLRSAFDRVLGAH